MKQKMVCVGKVVDEFGEFYIYRDFTEDIVLPKKVTNNFTGKGIETPTNPVIINKIKVNRKNYYVVKESKLLKK